MIIKEIQLLSEGLWESVKTDLDFFSSIQTFVRKLAEFDFTDLDKESIKELIIYSQKINDFFERYRSSGDGFYIPPHQTSANNETVKQIFQLINRLNQLPIEELKKEQEKIKLKTKKRQMVEEKYSLDMEEVNFGQDFKSF